MTHVRSRATRSEQGFSLVEVLLSAGLLAGVLLSISSLFVLGSQSVRSGRELTKATTVANSAVEQVRAWSYDKVYGFAGASGASTTGTWSSDAVNPSYVGSAADVADWTATANAWRDEVEANLNQGALTYTVDGISNLPTEDDTGLDQFAEADFIRVRIRVQWTENNGRTRHVTFEQLTL